MPAPPDGLVAPKGLLSDGVIEIRSWQGGDAPALAAALCDPDIYRWTLLREGFSEEDIRDWVAENLEPKAGGRRLEFAVVDAHSGRLLGGVGLGDFDPKNGVAEIFYWTAADARGRGVASRAVTLLSSWAFAQSHITRLELYTHLDNYASQRVAERSGFAREGILRSCRVVKGERVDLLLFSLLPIDLPRLRE